MGFNPKNVLDQEPVVIATAIVAVVNFAILMGWASMSVEAVGGLNTALVLVLGLFTRHKVTPTAGL